MKRHFIYCLGKDEANNLRIRNIDEFLYIYGNCNRRFNNGKRKYKTAFEVLFEAEQQILTSRTFPDVLMIDYKQEGWLAFGYVIFRFVEIIEEKHKRIVIYDFESTAS